MLALTIKEGNEFWIGDSRVVIQSVGKSHAKVLIDAPREIRILRGELRQREMQLTQGSVRDAKESQGKKL